MDNIIEVSFGPLRTAKTRPVFLVDHGMVLKFKNLELPQAYEVHFSNDKTTPAKTSIGDENGVVIPDEYFHNAERIYAWLYLHNGESGYTAYEVEIPLRQRSEVSDIEPTPQQETAIEQAITALNAAVEQTAADVVATGRDAQAAERAAETAVAKAALAGEAAGAAATAQGKAEDAADDAEDSAGEAAGYASDASGYATAAESAASSAQEDADFLRNASAVAESLPVGSDPEVNLEEGVFTFGMPLPADGHDGYSPTIGVSDITGGHRVTVTDKNGTRTFDVMDGEDGDDGVSPTITVTSITGGHRVTITDATGTQTFDVMDGQNPSDLDAGDIAYDDSETYPADTVGSEISSVKSALSQKADEPTGAKASGKVYGLDSSLNPVWLTQSGGGGGDDCAPVIVDSASGAIASFPDGTARPVVGLNVGIEPVQDLHGYANPWPGGGGKNLFGPNTNPTPSSYLGNTGQIISGSGWTVSDYIAVLPETQYTFSPNTTEGNSAKINFLDADKGFLGYINSGPQTFITPQNCYFMRFSYRESSTNIQLELGSSATSFAPYSNICPISGWTGTDVWVEPTHDTTAQPTLSISWQTEAGTVLGGSLTVNEDGSADLVVTLTGKHFSDLTWTNNSTPHAYNGDGFNNRVTRIDGSNALGCYCDVYKWYTATALASYSAGIALSNSTGSTRYRIYVKDDRFANKDEFIESFESNDPLVVCPLETPQTYHLTDIDTLSTLLGTNNIWCDTGDTSVTYRADTKGYITKAIAAAIAAL